MNDIQVNQTCYQLVCESARLVEVKCLSELQPLEGVQSASVTKAGGKRGSGSSVGDSLNKTSKTHDNNLRVLQNGALESTAKVHPQILRNLKPLQVLNQLYLKIYALNRHRSVGYTFYLYIHLPLLFTFCHPHGHDYFF